MHTYSRLMFTYGRNQHNIVSNYLQLKINKKCLMDFKMSFYEQNFLLKSTLSNNY